MKEIYGIDMELTQYPKILKELPPVDIVVTMGCSIQCPYLPCKRRVDWDLEDPTGKSDEEYRRTINAIEEKINNLCYSMKQNPIN
jgi:arsenate reductase